MTERIKEQLSTFLDGELPEAETALLLKRLERDLELRGALSRYSLIGAVLRSDGDMPAARQVAARVSAAIAQEPLPRSLAVRALRPLAGLGVAAAVASLAVLLAPRLVGPPEVAPPLLAAASVAPAGPPDVAERELEPLVAAAAGPPPSYTTPPAVTTSGSLPAAHFANYLVAHSDYASPLARDSAVTGLIMAEGAEAGSAARQGAVPRP